jgi:hypothetical protein
MNWYFNNNGQADGPHDDADMRARVKRGAVTERTLVWQASMESWQEAAALNASWWQPLPAKAAAQPKPPTGPLTEGLRRPVPHAPMGSAKPSKIVDFFKGLFRRGS